MKTFIQKLGAFVLAFSMSFMNTSVVLAEETTNVETESKALINVNDTDYASFQEAFQNCATASDLAIILKDDVNESLTIPTGTKATLNLNGKTLTNTDGNHTITVENEATLTVTGDGTVDNVSSGKAAVFNKGTANLEDGSYTRSKESDSNSYYVIQNVGNMVMDNITVTSSIRKASLIANGYYSYKTDPAGCENDNPTLTINSGTYTGGLATLKNDEGGVLYVKGGTFENANSVVVQNWNVATINGGTFNASNEKYAVIENNKYSNDGKKIAQGLLSINGGTFTTKNENIFSHYSEEYASTDITITAGSFNKEVSEDYIVEGKTVKEENGYYVVGEKVNVVAIGTKEYTSISEAINAVDSEATLRLLNNVKESIVIPNKKIITLDLNEKTLTNTDGDHTITVENGATLTVTGSGTVNNVSNGKAAVFNKGTANLEDGSYTRSKESDSNSYYVIQNVGDMVMDNITVTSNIRKASLIANGYYSYKIDPAGCENDNPTLTINEGTYTGGLATLKNDEGGVLYVKGGTFENANSVVVQNWNVATINGGTFNASNEKYAVIENNKYSNDGKNIAQGLLTIYGGTFTTKNENIFSHFNEKYASTDITITAGTFNKEVSKDYIAGGKVVNKREDGYYVVGDEVKVVAIGSNEYTSISEAINAVDSEATLRLLNNVKESIVIPNKKIITLDLNEKTLTNTDGDHTITVENGATLTVTGNGTVDNVSSGKAAVFNKGTANLNNGSYTRSNEGDSNSYYVIQNVGNMVMDNITVKSSIRKASLIANGYYSYKTDPAGCENDNPTLTIHSGTYTGGLATLKNDEGGVLYVKGGTFENSNSVVVQNWNVATINGGTFNASNAKYAVIENNKYSNDDKNIAQGLLSINGGTFTTKNANIFSHYSEEYASTDITITAGSFNKEVGYIAKDSKGATVNGMFVVINKDTIDTQAANEVETKIQAIGTVEYKAECKELIDAARNAYNALTDAQKEKVSKEALKALANAEEEYSKLEEKATQDAKDTQAAKEVETKIQAIGIVEYTEECKALIDAARNAYNTLTDAQKAKVSSDVLAALVNVEAKYAELEEKATQDAKDTQAAYEVETKIQAIGTVEYTAKCKALIDAARNAYNALTNAQQAKVSEGAFNALTSAEAKYAELKDAANKDVTNKDAESNIENITKPVEENTVVVDKTINTVQVSEKTQAAVSDVLKKLNEPNTNSSIAEVQSSLKDQSITLEVSKTDDSVKEEVKTVLTVLNEVLEEGNLNVNTNEKVNIKVSSETIVKTEEEINSIVESNGTVMNTISSLENSKVVAFDLSLVATVKTENVNVSVKVEPKNKAVTVVLPYPEGTNMNSYSFVLLHEVNGQYIAENVTKTANGLVVNLNQFSPFVLVANEVRQPVIIPSRPSYSGGGSGGSSSRPKPSTSQTDKETEKEEEINVEEEKTPESSVIDNPVIASITDASLRTYLSSLTTNEKIKEYSTFGLKVYNNSRVTSIKTTKTGFTVNGYMWIDNVKPGKNTWREIVLVNMADMSKQYAYRKQGSATKTAWLNQNMIATQNGKLDLGEAGYSIDVNYNNLNDYVNNKSGAKIVAGTYQMFIRISDGKNSFLFPLVDRVLSDGSTMESDGTLPEGFNVMDNDIRSLTVTIK